MQFILANVDLSSNRTVVLFQFIQVMDPIVRNSNRANFSDFLGFHHGKPGAFAGPPPTI